MDCDCQKNKENKWPSKEDETGEMVFHTKETDLFDRIINRHQYDYSEEEDDDLFLEELTRKIKPLKDSKIDQKDEFISQLRANTFKLKKTDRDRVFDSNKEKQIRMKLYKLK